MDIGFVAAVLGGLLALLSPCGALLLPSFFAYALGMVLPMFFLALWWDRYDLGRRQWLRGRTVKIGPLRTHTTALLSGGLFVGIGVLFLVFDGTASMSGLPGAGWMEQVALQAQEPLSRLGGYTDSVALVALATTITVLVAAWGTGRGRGGPGKTAHDSSDTPASSRGEPEEASPERS